jgi:nitrite reductase (NAD(P)H)
MLPLAELYPNEHSTTCVVSEETISIRSCPHRSAAIRYGDSQLAVFHVPDRGLFATQQMCPHRVRAHYRPGSGVLTSPQRAFVLEHGIVGDDADGNVYVSCPLHKRNYELTSGRCLSDSNFQILAFEARLSPSDASQVQLKLPPADKLDDVIGTEKWMVKKATAEMYGRGGAGQVEIAGPQGHHGPQGELVLNDEAAPIGGKLTW